MLVLGTQVLPQACWPTGHTQLFPFATKGELQAIPQLVPLHVGMPLAPGEGHAVHDVGPQLVTLLLLTQALLHTC